MRKAVQCAWLAAALGLFVVVGCDISSKSANANLGGWYAFESVSAGMAPAMADIALAQTGSRNAHDLTLYDLNIDATDPGAFSVDET
ncbi:MAG: hypothetical protein R3A47_09230, partial [Polyangiales bacterium]